MTLTRALKDFSRPYRRSAARIAARLAGLPDPAAPAADTSLIPADEGIYVTLQYAVHPRPRFGETWQLPRHKELLALIAREGQQYEEILQSIAAHAEALRRIPVRTDDERDPCWINGWLPGLDTASLYAFVRDREPQTYLEVGSGNSTKVVRRAIEDGGLRTRIVSIDPQPRAICDQLCDEVIREPLEDVDLKVFAELGDGDVCFIDNSHCAYQNSDVTVSFLEVLPRLERGVLLGFHDIYLPDDYPLAWSDRWYNEQYLLAAFLLGGGGATSIEFPAWFVAKQARNQDALSDIWRGPAFAEVERHGNGFWLKTG